MCITFKYYIRILAQYAFPYNKLKSSNTLIQIISQLGVRTALPVSHRPTIMSTGTKSLGIALLGQEEDSNKVPGMVRSTWGPPPLSLDSPLAGFTIATSFQSSCIEGSQIQLANANYPTSVPFLQIQAKNKTSLSLLHLLLMHEPLLILCTNADDIQ